ncbi:MAG: MMPL family transporter [Planctomycetaceae bacterium]|nr:MMPL family transporter [Planctomycetaceae bacterium]
MSAERMPSERDQSLPAQFMTGLLRLILRFPVLVVVAALALTAGTGYYSWKHLGYKTSRHDLVNSNNEYGRLWNEYIKEFGEEDDAVVVVEGESRAQVVPVLRELATALAGENKHFHAVLHGVNLEKIRSKGLHYLPVEDLQNVEKFLDEAGAVVHGAWNRLSVGGMVQGMTMRMQYEQAGAEPAKPSSAEPQASELTAGLNVPAETQLARLGESLYAAFSQQGGYHSPWPEMPSTFAVLSELNSEYLLTKEGRLGFVLLRLAQSDDDGFARGAGAVEALRTLLAKLRLKHPEVQIGLTGIPVLEFDEMATSQSSMTWASMLSLVGVALLFIAGFGGMRHALLANLVLLVGMAWTFGYVTYTVGHLNILSVSFAATLIGIGIDYGIHFVARYLKLREQNSSTEAALTASMNGVGPAIATGAVTTAISFFAAGLTNFTGVAELGIIAGGGILICAVAELFVLPPIILLVDKNGSAFRRPDPLPVHEWIAPLMAQPGKILVVTTIFTVVVGAGMSKLWYDHNLLNMQADGLESVELERKLLSECSQSMWFAVSMADSREELLARKEKLLKLGSVERTEEIVSLLPVDHERKQPIIERIQSKLAGLPERPPLVPVDKPDDLGQLLAGAQQALTTRHQVRSARTFEQVRDSLRRLPIAECTALLSQFQQQMAGDLLSRLHALRTMANPEPPQLTDLPESLVHRFVGMNNRHLLKIYGRGNIWDMDALTKFVKDVRSVDAKATGNPLQAYEASLEMKGSYEQSALLALAVILSVLWFNFRSVRYALVAALPLGVGVLQTFGILGILNLPLNPANMIALPLMLGLGVDYGIHIVHDYLEQKGPYRMSPSTAVAVLVDSLTTIVGFGALMIASHQGLQSLGRVLTIGVSACLFTSMIMLPALLTWLSAGRKEPTEVIERVESDEMNELPATIIVRRDEPHAGGEQRSLQSPQRRADRNPSPV